MTRQQGSASFLEKREEKKQPRMSEMFGNDLVVFLIFTSCPKEESASALDDRKQGAALPVVMPAACPA